MNALTQVRNTQRISREEVVRGTSGHASWHDQYKASAYVYAGGLSFDLTEGDVLAVFSQYGEVVDVNLVRSKDTGKSKGFAFLCYEDQRSTVLAVDNLNGAKVAGRIVRVEHVQDYKKKKLEEEEEEGLGEEEEGLGGQGVVCAVADASDVNQGFRRRNKEGSSSSGGRGRGRGRGPEEEKEEEEEDGGNADNKSGGESFPWEASDSVFNILKEARKEVYGEEPRDERGEEDRLTDKRSHKRRKHRHKHRRKHRHDH